MKPQRALLAILALAFAALAVPAPAGAQAAAVPPFVAGANKVYCHASEDSLSVWMSTLEDDGAVPYQIFGEATTDPDPVLGLTLDPVANQAFTTRIALTPVLSQDLVLDGTINVQAYIGGGSATAGAGEIAAALSVDGTSVASAEAKDHTMTPKQAGTTYDPISWTMTVTQLAVPAGSTLEWVLSGTITVGNNVYLACHEARGRSYIELPVASLGAAPGGAASDPFDTDADGLNDTWEQDHFGNTTLQNGSADPDGDGLNNTAEQELGTDPNEADTDGDGASDGDEVAAGTDPLDPASAPPSEDGAGDDGNGTDDGSGADDDGSGDDSGSGDGTAGTDSTVDDSGDKGTLDEFMDAVRGDTGYAGASAAGMGAVLVLSLIGLAGRWGL